jgi:hypothetical protein
MGQRPMQQAIGRLFDVELHLSTAHVDSQLKCLKEALAIDARFRRRLLSVSQEQIAIARG